MTDMHFIKGAILAGTSGRSKAVFNPATGLVVGSVPLASASEVDTAVSAAKAALPGWANTPPAKRAQIMFKFRDLINQNLNKIAGLISGQHGKTIDDARGEVARGLEVVEFACGIPHLLKGEYSAQVASAVDSYSLRQPVGVVAGITPFNFPAMVPMWMVVARTNMIMSLMAMSMAMKKRSWTTSKSMNQLQVLPYRSHERSQTNSRER